jgi:hypothetical protein
MISITYLGIVCQHGRMDKKKTNVQNENDNDTNVNYETFTIDKNSSNQQI